jgi:hypothetical protein
LITHEETKTGGELDELGFGKAGRREDQPRTPTPSARKTQWFRKINRGEGTVGNRVLLPSEFLIVPEDDRVWAAQSVKIFVYRVSSQKNQLQKSFVSSMSPSNHFQTFSVFQISDNLMPDPNLPFPMLNVKSMNLAK